MMIGEIVCVFHHPLALLGLLPLRDGFGRVDVRIFYVAHGKSMEVDLHWNKPLADSLTGGMGVAIKPVRRSTNVTRYLASP